MITQFTMVTEYRAEVNESREGLQASTYTFTSSNKASILLNTPETNIGQK